MVQPGGLDSGAPIRVITLLSIIDVGERQMGRLHTTGMVDSDNTRDM